MGIHHLLGRGGHAVAVSSLGDIVPYGSTGSLLHRNAFGVGPISQRSLFVLGQTERHSHDVTVSVRYHRLREAGAGDESPVAQSTGS